MKLKILFSLFTASAVFLLGFIPKFVADSINSTAYTIPEITEYQKIVNCSGTVSSLNIYNIYLETPVIADNVCVEIGDTVQKGQLMANINTTLTKSVVASSEKVNVDVSASNSELLTVAEKYGISAEQVIGYLSENNSTASTIKNQTAYIPDTIIAPINGTVTQLNLSANTLSKTSVPVITVSDCKNYIVKALISETKIGDVKTGNKAIITCSASPNKKYVGYVKKIYPTATKVLTATLQEPAVTIEISLENADEAIKDGFSSDVQIITSDSSKKLLIIPFEAVRQDENNVEYVYVYENSKISRRNIKTGLELYYGVEVKNGLSNTDIVIFNPDIINEASKMVFIKGREYVKR